MDLRKGDCRVNCLLPHWLWRLGNRDARGSHKVKETQELTWIGIVGQPKYIGGGGTPATREVQDALKEQRSASQAKTTIQNSSLPGKYWE